LTDAGATDAAGEGGTTYTMYVTFYGWADNSPPGNAIAYPMNGGYPTVHNAAGGTGTFTDPITLATDEAELPIGTIVYIPFIEKYLVMEDDCTECDQDWTSTMKRHVDVWMNSDGTDNATDLTNCEDQWTKSAAAVQVNPAAGLPVTTAPLFDPSTNVCRTTP
jgi:3D (Asp-Asp-Asp) domain-containing protein